MEPQRTTRLGPLSRMIESLKSENAELRADNAKLRAACEYAVEIIRGKGAQRMKLNALEGWARAVCEKIDAALAGKEEKTP